MNALDRQLSPEELTRSQRRALNYVTAQGTFEVHRLELLSEMSRDVFVVVVGASRECWRITARGRAEVCR